MTTKDEAREECKRRVEERFRAKFGVAVGNISVKEWNQKVAAESAAFDAYAQAAVEKVLADTLGLLERLAKLGICCEWTNVREDGSCVTILVTHTGDGEYVYSQGVSGGVEYSAVHGDDGCTRAEALALLAGEEKKE